MAPATCNCYKIIPSCTTELEYIDCDGVTQYMLIEDGVTYNVCSQTQPIFDCIGGLVTNLGNCVNGECPTPPPPICICNKVTNTTNETQTYCYIDCDSNQQSIILQPGESSDKICVSAWTECITCDCLEGTFNSSGVDINFKFEKTNQIKNGKPVYYSYIIYNNDYSQYGRYTLTFELDNCWYAIPDTNFYEFVGPSFTLCENIDCPIGVWQKIECSCLDSTFTTPDIGFGLNFYITSIDENGYAIFKTYDSNYKIIYNILLVRWEFIEVSTESLIAYYVTDSQCPYTGIFSPVNWTTIDLNNSFSLDGFADCFENFSTIKCEPKCDCINIILTVSPYGSPVYYSTLLTPTGNIVNSKPEYTIVFISNSEIVTVNWNSITNCWELIDNTSTVSATLCDSSDPSCPIGNWEIAPGKDLDAMSSNYCIDSILPENIENFGDCIDGQCPIIPVTTTTTTFFPPPPVPLEPTNECDVITIFPMGVECFSINPSFTDTYDGSASLYITGGTPPYEILWENKSVGTTINNLGVGEYKATVTDSYGDFLINTTCVLSAETPSPTTTTSTTTLPQFGDLCVIYTTQNDKIPQSQFADFIFNGYYNEKPSWLSSDGNFFMYWNTGTTEEWLISGSTSFVVYNPNPDTPPLNGWQILGAGKTTITVLEGSCDNLPPLQMQLAINNPSCGNNGSIIVTANGGIPPYFYSKDGGSTFQYNPIFNNLGSGNYSIVTKDSTGTLQTQIVTLTSSSLPTTYNLTLNRSGNNLSVSITPPLPNGVSVIFDLITNSQFNVAPLATSAVNNVGANILVNGSPITPNSPVINNTTTTNLCNGTTFITTTSLTWSNITLNNTSTFSGTLFNTISPVLPLPSCYTATSNTNVIINNPRIQGCECCNVVIIQEAQTRGNANSIFV